MRRRSKTSPNLSGTQTERVRRLWKATVDASAGTVHRRCKPTVVGEALRFHDRGGGICFVLPPRRLMEFRCPTSLRPL